jgi:phosphatidylglycerophosphatase A
MRRLGVALATVAGVGYWPIAPGTAGSAVGALLYLLTRSWPMAWQAALIVAISVVGVWAGGVAARHFGREDPGQVVIDEVAGQLVTFFATGISHQGVVVGFLIFRVFDIVKPWPARQFERLPGGSGIMADDLMVGVYGNLLLRLAIALTPTLGW